MPAFKANAVPPYFSRAAYLLRRLGEAGMAAPFFIGGAGGMFSTKQASGKYFGAIIIVVSGSQLRDDG